MGNRATTASVNIDNVRMQFGVCQQDKVYFDIVVKS